MRQVGYFGLPMVIVYRLQAISYWLAKLLVRIKYVGLINIVAEKRVVPELIQNDFTPQKAGELLKKYLNKDGNSEIRNQLKNIRIKLGDQGVSARAADYVVKFIRKK
jgi:lipid-A-disaccharide synthase